MNCEMRYAEDALEKMTNAELFKIAVEMGLEFKMPKVQLVTFILSIQEVLQGSSLINTDDVLESDVQEFENDVQEIENNKYSQVEVYKEIIPVQDEFETNDPFKIFCFKDGDRITEQTVKKAFKKLCLIHHPDKCGKHENFLKIQEAYKYIMARIQIGFTDYTYKEYTYEEYTFGEQDEDEDEDETNKRTKEDLEKLDKQQLIDILCQEHFLEKDYIQNKTKEELIKIILEFDEESEFDDDEESDFDEKEKSEFDEEESEFNDDAYFENLIVQQANVQPIFEQIVSSIDLTEEFEEIEEVLSLIPYFDIKASIPTIIALPYVKPTRAKKQRNNQPKADITIKKPRNKKQTQPVESVQTESVESVQTEPVESVQTEPVESNIRLPKQRVRRQPRQDEAAKLLKQQLKQQLKLEKAQKKLELKAEKAQKRLQLKLEKEAKKFQKWSEMKLSKKLIELRNQIALERGVQPGQLTNVEVRLVNEQNNIIKRQNKKRLAESQTIVKNIIQFMIDNIEDEETESETPTSQE